MLKQRKNSNTKNKFGSNFQKRSGIRQNKIAYKLRKIFKNKAYFINPTFQEVSINNQNSYLFSKKIDIRVTPNNVFCTLKNCFNNKTIKVGSAGKYKVKTSKKTLKFSCKIIVGFFLREIRQDLNSKKILINLTGPITLRKSLIEQVTKSIKKNSITLNVNQKKCFNGCRPPKKRRKKQKGLRLFK
jgi:ribosomal protein S11